jgi:hypothetical protein
MVDEELASDEQSKLRSASGGPKLKDYLQPQTDLKQDARAKEP